jgi:predicted aldo/keto reductase-like oxidoreductase
MPYWFDRRRFVGTGNLTRGDFLKLGIFAAALGSLVSHVPLLVRSQSEAESSDDSPLEFRTLGRTGLKVTAVSIGCMVTPEAVIAKAFEMGINFFDTAHVYKSGMNEREVGRVLKGKRHRAYICTKVEPGPYMLDHLHESLDRLQTDYVDLLLLHGASDRETVHKEPWIAALLKAKEGGKARFIGVSVHSNMAEVLDAAVEAKVYDAVLTRYNFQVSQDVRDAVARTAAAGIGIIAMKTQRGGFRSPAAGLTPHQAALKWVLDDPNVTCAVPGMTEFKHLDENFAVMGKRLSLLERRRLQRFARLTSHLYCSGCIGCAGTCPFDVEIPEVRRCAMYLQGYGDEALARENYRRIARNAAPCVNCSMCEARCATGVSLQPILTETHRRLA